jgi:hypothetical protein
MGTRKVSKLWFMALLLVVFVAGCGRQKGIVSPTLTSISPNTGAQGQTVAVTLTGVDFATGATINTGGALITVTNTTVTSSTQITATFTIAANAVLGAANISVTTSGEITNAVTFTIGSAFAVSSVIPANAATNVPINQVLSATFSAALNCATVTTTTFTVSGGVTGTVTCAGSTATFTPTSRLASNTSYTATLTTGIMNSLGAPLLSNFVWTFTTAPLPTVISTIPTNGATGVPTSQVLTANFSEAMNCATITTSTFTVSGGVTGTVACAGASATFTPGSPLAANTTYTATVTTGVTNVGGGPLASNYVWSFTTGQASGITPPTVTAVTPLNNATGVPLNTALTAAFSEAMSPATITAATFTLTGPGATPVGGAVTYNSTGEIATLTPASTLAPLTLFTATITTGVTNLSGTAMAANFVWTFTTGAAPDTTPPTVISTNPLNLATGVPVNQAITATFSKAMTASTISQTTFTLMQGVTPITGAVTYVPVGTTATFTPTVNLTANTTYTATVTTGVADLAGNLHMVSPYVWSFTTGAPLIAAPTVLSTNPANNATGVCFNATVNATFSEPMNPTTINTATFTLDGPSSTPVTGTVSLDVTGTIATFTPVSNLAPSTTYVATITTGVTNLAGIPMAANEIWVFTTAASACLVPPPLGAAAIFGAFGGGSGMTNEGINTVVNGSIGTTGASSTMTGFHDTTVLPYIQFTHGCIYTETTAPPAVGTVNGEIYTAPGTSIPSVALGCTNEGTGPAATPGTTFYVATQAALAAQAAYNAMIPASLPGGAACPGAGNGAGLTLAPGIYTCATTFDITLGDLTLDGQGNANAVWIFQIGSALTVGDTLPRNVILKPGSGAQAKNVFWQVASEAVINYAGGGTMVGTIIASAGVTLSSPANDTSPTLTVLNGRALGLNASVTMVNTVINVPAP